MEKSIRTFLQNFKDSEASTSVLFGFIVVFIAGLLLFNYFRDGSPAAVVSDQGAATESAQVAKGTEVPKEHVVAKGENLWKIAEKVYGSGYNWTDIAKANKITNPKNLITGTKLTIPQVTAKKATTVTLTSAAVSNQIKDAEYVVVKGDTMWDIAVRAYGDGFAWTKIWEANKQSVGNPRVIEPGLKLTLPR